MTTDDMRRIAGDLVPPIGTTGVGAVVDPPRDHRDGCGPDPCRCVCHSTGGHRAAWIVDGRLKVPIGPRFDRPRDACRFVDILTGAR